MAKIEYAFPVDKVHGRISKHHKVGFAHRKASKRNYTTVYSERDLQNNPYTEKELAHRAKFTAVAAATRSRMADPSQAAADMAAFKAQTKYKSLYQYVFRLEWNAYEG